MKHLVTLAFAGVMAFALTACGGEQPKQAPAKAPAAEAPAQHPAAAQPAASPEANKAAAEGATTQE